MGYDIDNKAFFLILGCHECSSASDGYKESSWSLKLNWLFFVSQKRNGRFNEKV